MYCTVVCASRSPRIGAGLTYAMGDLRVKPGQLVRLPLRGKTEEGIVIELSAKKPERGFTVKEVQKILDATPLLTEAQLTLLPKICDEAFCTPRQALSLLLPPPPWSRLLPLEKEGSTRRVKSASDLREVCLPTLLLASLPKRRTDYTRAIEHCLRDGRQVLLLAPTTIEAQGWVTNLRTRFPEARTELQTGELTLARRRALWRECRNGDVNIVVGTRTAVFAPLPSLGLIIVDREEDALLTSERSPNVDARAIAHILAKAQRALLLLGTSCPSLESWHASHERRFTLSHFSSTDEENPKVTIVDLHATMTSPYPLSLELLSALTLHLTHRHPCLLLLNRRGIGTQMACRECRRPLLTSEGYPYAVHRRAGTPLLVSPHTGETAPVPARCPHCGSVKLTISGAGTEGVEEALRSRFPRATIQRIEGPRLTEGTVASAWRQLTKGATDILLGTSALLSAPLDAHVPFTACLLADVGLSQPHFRAGERIVQLLHRLKSLSSEEYLLQTFCPSVEEIQSVLPGKLSAYLDGELGRRREAGYPPFGEVARLLFRGEGAEARARTLLHDLEQHAPAALASLEHAGRAWTVDLRSPRATEVLRSVDLRGSIVHTHPLP